MPPVSSLLKNSDAGDVVAVGGVHADGVAFFDEVGDHHFGAGFDGDLFGHAGGGIAADSGFSGGHEQIHVDGKFHVDDLIVVEGQLYADTFFEVRSGIFQNFDGNSRLFEGFIIHEIVEIAVSVKIIYILEFQ